MLHEGFKGGLVLGLGLVLSACTVVDTYQDNRDRAAQRAAESVHDYCTVFDSSEQDVFRNRVDGYITPHAIRIDCADVEE